MSDDRPAKELDKIIVRLPDGMRDRLAEVAKENKRSVNAEVVARLQSSLDTSIPGTHTIGLVNVVLDTDGLPISWHEIHEHLHALTSAGRLNVAAMEVRIITPRMVSSTLRDKETLELAKSYRSLLRKSRSAIRRKPSTV